MESDSIILAQQMLIPTGTGRPANPLYRWNLKSLIWYTWKLYAFVESEHH